MATLTLRPNGAGNKQEWDAEGGSYTAVDEASSDGDTTRLYTPTDNRVATFALEDHTSEAGTINSVTVYINIKGLDPVSNDVQLALRTASTDYFSSTKNFNNTSYHLESNAWTTNPNTSSAWTWSEIDALEAGMKRIGGGGQAVTQVYIVVDYTSATVEQEGYRFRDDDGSETTASWLASQDTNITRTRAVNTRLRMLLNTTGDLTSEQFQLEHKLSTDSIYTKVVPDDYVSIVNESMASTPATGTVKNSAAWNAGGYLKLTDATNGQSGQIEYSSGLTTGTYTIEFDAWAGGGNGADSIWFYFGCFATPSAEDNSEGGVNIALSEYQDNLSVYTFDGQFDPIGVANLDNSTWRHVKIELDFQGTDVYDNPGQPHDGETVNIWGVLVYIDGTQYYDQYYTISVLQGGTLFGFAARCGGLNNEHRIKNCLVYSGTFPGDITLATSSNITASGANTTAQLTAPSGKSTSDFVAGRIQDDENPADTVDITSDDYTEMEWCLKAQSTATDGNIYDFRVTINGVAIGTYTVTPQWTIGTASAPTARRMALLGIG